MCIRDRTGNIEKLRKMLKIAEMRRDIMGRFHNSLFLGDATERTRVLEAAGQSPLAYVTAVSHGMLEEAGRIKELLQSAGRPIPIVLHNSQLMQPPTPILRSDNWPLLAIPKSTFRNSYEDQSEHDDTVDNTSSPGWDADLDLDEHDVKVDEVEAESDEVGGWGEDLDIDDAANEDADYASSNLKADEAVSRTYIVPVAGICPENRWCKNSAHAADHAAAGSFGSSMNYLNRQISIVNFSPMRGRFLVLHAASKSSVPGLPLSSSYEIAMLRDGNVANGSCFPRIANSMPQLIDALRNSYRLFQKGNFQASRERFHHILRCIPLIIAESRSHANEVGFSSILFSFPLVCLVI